MDKTKQHQQAKCTLVVVNQPKNYKFRSLCEENINDTFISGINSEWPKVKVSKIFK